MKKILASFALFLTITAALVGCGDRSDMSSDGRYDDRYYSSEDDGRRNDADRDDNTVKDGIHDAVDGVESAGDDVIDGVGDAVDDIVDGFDGDDQSETSRTSDTSEDVTDNR